MKVATLIDFQRRDQQSIENLYKKKLLAKKNVHTFARYTGTSEADIEDMFEPQLYLDAALLHSAEQMADLPVPVAESTGAVRIGHAERGHLVKYLAPNRRCCTALAESEIRLWWWPRYVSTMKYPKRSQYKHAKQKKYHVRNWAEYNEGLRRRGDLTVWFDEEGTKAVNTCFVLP